MQDPIFDEVRRRGGDGSGPPPPSSFVSSSVGREAALYVQRGGAGSRRGRRALRPARRRWIPGSGGGGACAPLDERYTAPQGLYPHPDIDLKKLRRLIVEAKLAPCHPGSDDHRPDLDECPICFLFYPSLNRSKCCAKGICTAIGALRSRQRHKERRPPLRRHLLAVVLPDGLNWACCCLEVLPAYTDELEDWRSACYSLLPFLGAPDYTAWERLMLAGSAYYSIGLGASAASSERCAWSARSGGGQRPDRGEGGGRGGAQIEGWTRKTPSGQAPEVEDADRRISN